MTIVRLVRHGEPAENVGSDPDLTDLGRAQASALAERLSPAVLVTSPLRRARSTARPLEHHWGVDAIVEPIVRELPSPSATSVDRAAWLRVALRGTFADLGPEHRQWRDAIVDFVRARRVDTVITTHAVVINAVVGHIAGDDRVWNMRPAHTSITTVEVDGSGSLRLIERGGEASSTII